MRSGASVPGDGSGRDAAPLPPSSSSPSPDEPRRINAYDPPSAAQLALRRAQIAEEEGEATRPYHARVQAPPLRGVAGQRALVLGIVCTWPNCVVGSVAEGSRFKRCGGCLAPYCSRNCQEGDWRRHRPECKAAIAARKEREFARAVVPFVARPAPVEGAEAEVEAEAAAPSESPAAAAERLRVEALPIRALEAVLAARGVSVLGLSERRELVEALLGAPAAVVAEEEAATAAAAVAATAPAVGAAEAAAVSVASSAPPEAADETALYPINICSERAAVDQWYSGAFAANLAAAERGDAAAQYAMGSRYYESGGVPQDFAQAPRWWSLAADQGFACAQFNLGYAYAMGHGVPKSDSEALNWWRLASAQGHPVAQHVLGDSYERGRYGLAADLDDAVRFYTLAATSSLPRSIANLRRLGFSPAGMLICLTCGASPPSGAELHACRMCKEARYCDLRCLARGRAQHEAACAAVIAKKAAQWEAMERLGAAGGQWLARPLADVRRAAERSDAAAQSVLAHYYDPGKKGLAKSPERAAKWRAKAALADHAVAQTGLGFHFDTGEGVAQDKAEAVRLYRLAAQQGFRDAQFNLALKLSTSEGCEKSPVQAVQWMRRAVELGDAEAQTELARWYVEGECGLPTNYNEAMLLARLGAEAGNATARTNIGYLFVKGWGVVQDLDEDCKWYRQAAALGEEAAMNNLCNLARAGHAPSIAAVRDVGLGPL